MRIFALLALLVIAAAAVSGQSTAPAPPTANTICDRLVAAANRDITKSADAVLTMQELVSALANGVPTKSVGVFNNALTKKAFNGTINARQVGPIPHPFAAQGASPDFTHDGTAQSTLTLRLVQFFGAPAALHCTATGFPAYVPSTGGKAYNQRSIHGNMNITQSVFNAFNKDLLEAAAYMKVSTADSSSVSAYLNGFGRNNYNNQNEICRMQDCACATGVTGANCDQLVGAAAGVQVSFVAMIAAVVLALFAMRR